MQSLENIPTSPTKRLGVSLNVDTGSKGSPKDHSPPETPTAQSPRPSKGKFTPANRALKLRTTPRETFLDDITPVDPSNKENLQLARPVDARDSDSHGLSISPRQVTRDSLVDHMLLSLDQFDFDQDTEEFGSRSPFVDGKQLQSSFGDDEPYQNTQNFAIPSSIRGATHNYSYSSSDYENADDASRYSVQLSRGRRSNSSSNFQSSLARINSIRIEGELPQTFPGPAATPPQIPTRRIHSRGQKGSGGSSANSIDLGYAQVTSVQRSAHGLGGRSSSFDYGRDRPNHIMGGQLNYTPTFAPYDDDDAAPTPTVPAGPRRPHLASPIMTPPDPVQADDVAQKLDRRRSTRSSKSAYKGKTGANISLGSKFDFGPDLQLPPVPAILSEKAPAPLVGYGKVKEATHPHPGLTQPSKDRPGFFRRVFGSSKINISTTPEPVIFNSHASPTSPQSADRPTARPYHTTTQMEPEHAAPLRKPPPTPNAQPHVLTKKPSSFFRRRKKSMSEPEPPLPLNNNSARNPRSPRNTSHTSKDNIGFLARSPSPVSSLRKVMNPYLNSPVNSPRRTPTESKHPQTNRGGQVEGGHVRTGFSSDYAPPKDATIRAIKAGSPDSHLSSPKLLHSSPKSGLSRVDGEAREETDATFLQDCSDNDPEITPRATHTPSIAAETTWLGRTMSPSPSVARDMALVAEYERVHSKRSSTAKSDRARTSPTPDLQPSAAGSKLGQIKPTTSVKEDEWVKVTQTQGSTDLNKENRVWLKPVPSDENLCATKTVGTQKGTEASPSPRASGSTDTEYKSATSLPIVQIDGEDGITASSPVIEAAEEVNEPQEETDNAPPPDDASPTDEDREIAKKIYDCNEEFIQKEKAAAWMGEEGAVHSRTLNAYIELYDFTNLNILASLRKVCGRLVLKGESQQVDRILDAFARRWCQNNPGHGFKATDVVHTICYSILLLNTDLHLADIDQKMTRSQFIKNTMPTVRQILAESAPDAFEPSSTAAQKQSGDTSRNPRRNSTDVERPSWRHSFRPPMRSESDILGANSPTPLDFDTPVDDCGPLVKAPFHGSQRTWEVQVEIVLKDFYSSIRNERLPLFGAPIEKAQLPASSSNSLAVFANGMLRRTPSILSKAPSETQTYARARTADSTRVGTGKWSSKNRSRPRLYPNSGMESSRTSLDDQSSMWSPSVSSSTWSKYSMGKTQTSMSVDSFGSTLPQADYQQAIGFANALSQAIIREETIGSTANNVNDREELRVAPLLEDESLELAGAPWAKEGIVKHKHHLESLDKRAKDRNWNEVFAVIEKGYMSLFSFTTKSMRNKSKGKAPGAVVGGGNWQSNAESLGSFPLRQTIASALPSPGYSKARPHVWALSLPTGAVHLFQVGTPDIVKEFVSTANYWSARLSNHPLVGGISNIEYGWSDGIVNNSLVSAIADATTGRTSTSARASVQSSLSSTLEQGRSRLPGDKIFISDWTSPTQTMRASNLMEPDQLRALLAYVAGIEEELQKHNQLRSPMLLAFTPRHPNAQKAMSNWEKKSSYLLREIVKFRTYIDCLQAAEAVKLRIYAQRAEMEKMEKEKAEQEEREQEADDDTVIA